MNDKDRDWYFDHIQRLDPKAAIVRVDRPKGMLQYNDAIRSDEPLIRPTTPEELVRALSLCLLASKEYRYSAEHFYIEKYYKHGHPSSKRDEVDLLILDDDDLPFAMWDFKSPSDFSPRQDEYIRFQLFGTAPLVGAPKLLVYATINPHSAKPELALLCIDRTQHQSFESWDRDGRPHTNAFPPAFTDPTHEPFTRGGKRDLREDCTQADFRAAAATFHQEFFGEHPDNTLFTNLMKCLLAKIYDEKQTKKREQYRFQVLYKKGKEESAQDVFTRVNDLYRTAYKRYIDPGTTEPDEINSKEFSPERVKTVVKVLQGMSITRGAALHGDVIGAFFEEILRGGFKQDKGMYFTHANLVYFMVAALDLEGLSETLWKNATHPENRLPYIIDPACGSGTFLLRAMNVVTGGIRKRKDTLVVDAEAEQFFNARMSDERPNYWAESFIYGMDPKFVMAITARVNMVLHGDGSTHIFKLDALKPLSGFTDAKLRPTGDPNRSIPRRRYDYDLAESFDVVLSNPPFGVTLATDTRLRLDTTFSLPGSAPSESFFLERWFQLLKPLGRMGVVVPESLLNSADNAEARLFLYRCFWLRAIVSLPRNLFIETPTLTSLLFAQKKSPEDIAKWDMAWDGAIAKTDTNVAGAEASLRAVLKAASQGKTTPSPKKVQEEFVAALSPVITEDTVLVRRGGDPLPVRLPAGIVGPEAAARYYLNMLKSASFRDLCRNAVFSEVSGALDYEYSAFIVDEVGFKLSKRKERVRPNQLALFVGEDGKTEHSNLHLAGVPVHLLINADKPSRVLDYIAREVKWQ